MKKEDFAFNYSTDLKGLLSPKLNITDIIESSGMGKKSGRLTIYGDDGEAIIYFRNGDILNVSYKQIFGIEALAKILNWQNGHFTFEEGLTTNQSNTDCHYYLALLSATKILDEKKQLLNGKTFSLDKEEKSMNSLREQLEDFLKVEGVNMVVVVGRDGFIIDSATLSNQNIDEVGAVVSTGMGSSESMGTDLGVGNMYQGMLEYENGIIFIRAVGPEAIFILVSTPNVNLGMIRLQIKKRIDNIKAAL